jgi:hypothetical protein
MRVVLRVLFGKAPRDPNIPFKIVKRGDWRRAVSAIGADNPLPSVLLALWLTKSGAKIVQFPIVHRAREGSVSELRGWKLFKFCVLAGRTLLAFRMNAEVRALKARPT